MKRKAVSKKAYSHKFSNSALKTKKKNVTTSLTRGGYRM